MESVKIIRDKCTVAGRCVDACYAEALVLHGREVTISELIKELERDKVLYQSSGGGVTLSGGEPTLQPRFASTLLKTLQTKGYHTAIDTCGYVDWNTFEKIVNHTDLVLFDLKHMDPVLHESETGVPNWLILSNLRKISEMDVETVVRIPIIPKFNASEDNFRVIGRFLEGLSIQKIELLPYHNLGVSKYKALGRSYPLHYLESPSLNLLRSYSDILEAKGLNVVIEGVD
jgi:pyruvate formate lyase activating enzyme